MIKEELNNRLDSEYQSLKPYLDSCDDLKEMCNNCGGYCGKDHNYEECLDKNCFKFYLGYQYLSRSIGYELFGGQ